MRIALVVWAALAMAGAVPVRAPRHCIFNDPNIKPCLSSVLGLEPAARFRDRGEQLIRIAGAGPMAIDVILPRSGPGVLIAREGEAPVVTRTYHFPRARFAALRAKLDALTGAGAALHGGTPKEEHVDHSFEGMPCLTTGEHWAEAALDGRVASADLDYCFTDDISLFGDIEDFALSLDPVCAGTLPKDWNSANFFDVCLHLSGSDRASAGAAFFASYKLTDWSLGAWDTYDPDVASLLAPEAKMQFSGGPPVEGPAIVEKLKSLLKTMSFRTLGARADGDRVIVHGTAEQQFDVGKSVETFQAPFTQIWRRGANGNMLLIDWQVGAFEAVR